MFGNTNLGKACTHVENGDLLKAKRELLNASAGIHNPLLEKEEVVFKELLSALTAYQQNIDASLKSIDSGNFDKEFVLDLLGQAKGQRMLAHQKVEQLAKLLKAV